MGLHRLCPLSVFVGRRSGVLRRVEWLLLSVCLLLVLLVLPRRPTSDGGGSFLTSSPPSQLQVRCPQGRVRHRKDPTDAMFVFSQHPSLWAVEPSPAHSPCPAHHGPLSNEIFMQPPNSSRVDGAGWPHGSTNSF